MKTSLEDRLRQGLRAAPTAVVQPPPLDEISRAARRRHGLIAVAGSAAVAAIVAGSFAVASMGGDGQHGSRPVTPPSPTPSPTQPAVVRWPDSKHTLAVTTTVDGSVWSLQRRYSPRDRCQVVQQDGDGTVIRRVAVPTPARGIASGAGGVWVYGGGDGGYPDGVLSFVNARGHATSIRFHGSGPYDVAFVDGTPFVTLAAADRVVTIGFGGDGQLVVQSSLRLPSQVTDIVATPPGEVWAREDLIHKVVQITAARGGIAVGHQFSWRSGLMAAADAGNVVWTSDSADRLIGLEMDLAARGSFSLAEGYRIDVPGQPIDVVGNGGNGAYVATTRGVAYYADLDVAGNTGRATATSWLPATGVVSMTAAPHGGVVVVKDGGGALQWNPAA